MLKPTIEIDGSRFDTLNDFWEEISVSLIPGTRWGRSFDAFNDVLRGGLGTPPGGFRLRWVNFQRSCETLGYPETIRWLENKIHHCHPDNIEFVARDRSRARR
jgi:RNAse (barnase) inhibitor barstar